MTYLEKKAISRHMLKALRQGRVSAQQLSKSLDVPLSTIEAAIGSSPGKAHLFARRLADRLGIPRNAVETVFAMPQRGARRLIRGKFFESKGSHSQPKFLERILDKEVIPELIIPAARGYGGMTATPASVIKDPFTRATQYRVEKSLPPEIKFPFPFHMGRHSGMPLAFVAKIKEDPLWLFSIFAGGRRPPGTPAGGLRERLERLYNEISEKSPSSLAGVVRAHEHGEAEAIRNLLSGKLKKALPIGSHFDVLPILRELNEVARLAPYGSGGPYKDVLIPLRGRAGREIINIWKQFGGGPGRPLTEEQLQRVAERARKTVKPDILGRLSALQHATRPEEVRPWGTMSTDRLFESLFGV